MGQSQNTAVMLSPEDIIFDIHNTRFAGMEVSANDPTPYLNRMEKMATSMIECCRETGFLLMQPIVVEKVGDKYAVRAGYTRAMTFVHKYEEISAEYKDIKIQAMVMSGINRKHSLMENVMRQDQHFMSIAFTVTELTATDDEMTWKEVAKSLGYKTSRVMGLCRIPFGLLPGLQKLAWEDVVTEDAAIELTKKDDKTQQVVLDYIIEEDVRQIKGKDVNEIISHAFFRVPEYVPREAFTDLEGHNHPEIEAEEWYMKVEEELIDSERSTSKEEMQMRSRKYWEMLTKDLEIKDKEKAWDYFGDGWVETTMDAHPSVIGVWDRYNPFVKFFLKASIYRELEDIEMQAEIKKDRIMELAKEKQVKLNHTMKAELMRTLMTELGVKEDSETLKYVTLSKSLVFMGEETKEMLTTIMGAEVTRFNIESFDREKLTAAIGFVSLYGDYNITADHKSFFEEYDVDFEARSKELEAVIKKEKEAIMSGAKAKAESVIDKKDDILSFFMSLNKMTVTDGSYLVSAADYLLGEENPDKRVLKYIARGLKLAYKGSEALMQMRICNVIKKLEENTEFAITEEHLALMGPFHGLIDYQIKYELGLLENNIGFNSETMDAIKHAVVKKYYAFLDVDGSDVFHSALQGSAKNKVLAVSANYGAESAEVWTKEVSKALYLAMVIYLNEQFDIDFTVLTLPETGKLRILD